MHSRTYYLNIFWRLFQLLESFVFFFFLIVSIVAQIWVIVNKNVGEEVEIEKIILNVNIYIFLRKIGILMVTLCLVFVADTKDTKLNGLPMRSL